MFTIKDYAKYPFLPSIRERLKHDTRLNQPFSKFLDTDYGKDSLKIAKERINYALAHNNKKDHMYIQDASKSLASYSLSRMMISCMNDDIIDKFAAIEASRSVESFIREPREIREEIEKELGFSLHDTRIPLVKYVPIAASLVRKDAKFKLINSLINHGQISINLADTNIIFEERVKLKIKSDLPLPIHHDIKQLLDPTVQEIYGSYTSKLSDYYGDVTEEDFPPCIRRIMSLIRKKENPTHPERFALVTFLNSIGATEDDMLKMFETVRDFNLDMSKYMIQHIMGKQGGTQYKAPGCASLRTNNICRAGDDPICKAIKHPLGYYSKLKRRKKT